MAEFITWQKGEMSAVLAESWKLMLRGAQQALSHQPPGPGAAAVGSQPSSMASSTLELGVVWCKQMTCLLCISFSVSIKFSQ